VTWWAVGTAVVGAAGSYLSAKKANEKKSSWTDATTTTDPYKAGLINPDIDAALAYQRGIIQRGAPQVNAKGQITYAAVPTGARPGGPDSYSGPDPRIRNGPQPGPGVPHPTGPGPGGFGEGDIPDQYGSILSPSTAKNAGGGKGGKNKGKGGGGGGKKLATGTPTTSGTAPKSAADIFRDVAARGMEAGDTESMAQARAATGNILGAAGGGGPETTGFEKYNPILDRLAGTLEGDVGSRTGRDLLLGFLNENGRGGGANSNGSGAGGTGAVTPGRYTSYAPQGSRAAHMASVGGSVTTGGGAGSANANGVPDTMVPESYFGTETRKIMDEQANEAELAGLIDAMNQDTEKGMFRDMAQLDAAAAGSGRFGGDMWKGMSGDAREEALQEMLKTSSGVRMNDREARRQARLAALQGVNQRDLGLLGANVQREGIEASERSAGASAGAAAQGMADQIALAKRGQDLSALGALMDSEQFSLGQLGDVGAQLSGDRLNAMGMVPGMEGVGLSGLNAALGGGQGLNDITQMQNQFKLGQGSLGIQRQGLNQQLGMFNAGQSQNVIDDYMRTLLGVGGMGGTTRTVGQNVAPGAGVSTGGAAIMGGLGGALAGYGVSRGY
jgi:hypothetical protein